MTTNRNPQAAQMADESMIRTLAAQAQAIWPQECALFDRYALPPGARIADVGCGSGEITTRLARRFPDAEVVGVDVLEGPLAYARARAVELGARVRFELGDAFELAFADGELDLVVCRHLTQAVPEPERVLAELWRVCKPGGWLHVLSEDYGMLHFPARALDPDRLWRDGVGALARATSTDERIGRRTWSILKRLGVRELSVDYVVVDTLRVERETFAAIIGAWRDGYWRAIDHHAGMGRGEARALFDCAIEAIVDPDAYAVWQVPVISGRREGGAE
ncbi:MAG TPA: methyltransferase domain-containing protein [Labilithrix sp.]|nr:methyltransferase domain-containing protein [Labilithrix sp.]